MGSLLLHAVCGFHFLSTEFGDTIESWVSPVHVFNTVGGLLSQTVPLHFSASLALLLYLIYLLEDRMAFHGGLVRARIVDRGDALGTDHLTETRTKYAFIQDGLYAGKTMDLAKSGLNILRLADKFHVSKYG